MSESLYKDGRNVGHSNSNDDDDESSSEKHDFFDIFGSIFSKLHIWVGILIFILYILINTTFFVDDVLKKINSSFVSTDGNPTTNGIIMQGIFLSVGYIILDLLVSGGIL